VLNYIYTTKDLVIRFAALVGKLAFNVYSKTINLSLYAYSDALFADAKDRKSTLGYLFKFARYCLLPLVQTETCHDLYNRS
jgi:hypothetical protein